MSSKLIEIAAELERDDPLHEARLLVLLYEVAGKGKSPQPVDGIMKLAKMDFLLRYPNILERALNAIAEVKPSAIKAMAKISEEEKDTIEGRMIRFRFGPWDKRYRRWLAVMTAKDLVTVTKTGRTVHVALTDGGREIARKLANREEFQGLTKRANLVRFAVGEMAATRLMKFVYQIAPEIITMKWGDSIRL